eukprot:350933-Chlamydomonas_euryale.AAC.5
MFFGPRARPAIARPPPALLAWMLAGTPSRHDPSSVARISVAWICICFLCFPALTSDGRLDFARRPQLHWHGRTSSHTFAAALAGHNYIGTEHILLGLLREGEGVAARVLETLGADPAKIRTQVTSCVRTHGCPACV